MIPLEQNGAPIRPDRPNVTMGWHRFLIYFLIWALILRCAYNIWQAYGFYIVVHTEQLPYPTAFLVLHGIYGLCDLFIAVCLAKAWYDLWKFRRKGPKELFAALLVGIGQTAVIFLLSLTHWSFGPDGTSVRFYGFDPGNLYPLLGYIVLFALYRRYYNARDAFFVN